MRESGQAELGGECVPKLELGNKLGKSQSVFAGVVVPCCLAIGLLIYSQIDKRDECDRSHGTSADLLELDPDVIRRVTVEKLDSRVRVLFRDVVVGEVIGREARDYEAALSICLGQQKVGVRVHQTAYSFALINAMSSEINDDGFQHGPMMTVVICDRCKRVTSAMIQDSKF